MTPDRDLNHLFPAFRAKAEACVAELNAYLAKHHAGMSAKIIEGFRSSARQQELYSLGRTKPGKKVTQKNGTSNPSNHQSALAADIGIFQGAKYIEEPAQDIWDYLRHLAHVHDLTSGGDWPTFKDWPHLEWPVRDKATYAAAKAWKKAAGLI